MALGHPVSGLPPTVGTAGPVTSPRIRRAMALPLNEADLGGAAASAAIAAAQPAAAAAATTAVRTSAVAAPAAAPVQQGSTFAGKLFRPDVWRQQQAAANGDGPEQIAARAEAAEAAEAILTGSLAAAAVEGRIERPTRTATAQGAKHGHWPLMTAAAFAGAVLVAVPFVHNSNRDTTTNYEGAGHPLPIASLDGPDGGREGGHGGAAGPDGFASEMPDQNPTLIPQPEPGSGSHAVVPDPGPDLRHNESAVVPSTGPGTGLPLPGQGPVLPGQEQSLVQVPFQQGPFAPQPLVGLGKPQALVGGVPFAPATPVQPHTPTDDVKPPAPRTGSKPDQQGPESDARAKHEDKATTRKLPVLTFAARAVKSAPDVKTDPVKELLKSTPVKADRQPARVKPDPVKTTPKPDPVTTLAKPPATAAPATPEQDTTKTTPAKPPQTAGTGRHLTAAVKPTTSKPATTVTEGKPTVNPSADDTSAPIPATPAKPATEQPSTDTTAPADTKPATDSPAATDTPSIDRPVTDTPAAPDKPDADKPETDKPAADDPQSRPTHHLYHYSTTAEPKTRLNAGDWVATDRMRVTMRHSGSLVVSDEEGAIRWSSHTLGKDHHATMQDDGNLVVSDADENPKWASGTDGNPGAKMVIQKNGDVTVDAPDGTTLWSAGTAH